MNNRAWPHVLPPETRSLRWSALAGLLVLTAAYVREFYAATAVVTSTRRFLIVLILAVIAAVLSGELLTDRQAAIGAAGLSVIGLLYYINAAPGGWELLSSIPTVVRNLFVLATGTTILSIVSVDLWVLAVTPGPVFLSWHLALRSRYGAAAGVGVIPLLFLLLTGDLSLEAGLLGVLAAVACVGCGELARARAAFGQVDILAIVMAVMLVSSLAVTVIPASGGGSSGGSDLTTSGPSGLAADDAFVNTGGEMTVTGRPSLSPELRFTIEAPAPANWRVDAYDRYTGDGWVQTGESSPFAPVPVEEDAERARLSVRSEVDGISRMPALFEPRMVEGVGSIQQTPEGGLIATGGLEASDTYGVISARPNATRDDLRQAGWTFPDGIEARYTQLPSDTPERIGDLTANLTEDVNSPYEAALFVEQYLLETKEYSLEVAPPEEDIADEMLFEREEGYCVWFATTMAVMLRTQDIPARVVTGYSTGEQVDENRWVVRGMNAHAWVEVYLPDVGWVEFDPTPAAPYDDRRAEILENAREEERENVDTEESEEEWTPPEDDGGNDTTSESSTRDLERRCDDPSAIENGNLTIPEARAVCTTEQLEAMDGVDINASAGGEDEFVTLAEVAALEEQAAEQLAEQQRESEEQRGLPSSEWLALGAMLVIGAVAGIRRTDMPMHLRYAIGLRVDASIDDPQAATVRAWRRLEHHLARRYRPRRTGESTRAYLADLEDQYDLDPRVKEVGEAYETAQFRAGGIDAEDAREALWTVDHLVGGLGGGFRPR